MNTKLFNNIDYDNDPHWVVKDFFNSVHQRGEFLSALLLIIKKNEYAVNQDYCYFPDLSERNPAFHFAGVAFESKGGKVVVTEKQCDMYWREACNRYIEENPDDRARINEVLNGSIV